MQYVNYTNQICKGTAINSSNKVFSILICAKEGPEMVNSLISLFILHCAHIEALFCSGLFLHVGP